MQKRRLKEGFLMCLDSFILFLSGLLSEWIVFSSVSALWTEVVFANAIAIICILYVCGFYKVPVHQNSLALMHREFIGFVLASAIGILLFSLKTSFLGKGLSFFLIMDWSAFFYMLGIRIVYFILHQKDYQSLSLEYPRTLVYGAGEFGKKLVRESRTLKVPYNVIGFIDDNPQLHGSYIEGVKVVGSLQDMQEALDLYGVQVVVLAEGAVDNKRMYRIFEAVKDTGCDVDLLPVDINGSQESIEVFNADLNDGLIAASCS